MNTGLDSDCLAICVKLCENGVNPEALATVVRELRKQSEAIKREVRSTYECLLAFLWHFLFLSLPTAVKEEEENVSRV